MTRFSICLPVRNGMPYVKDCVKHILDQSFKDFELHILDNHSTDGTAEWLKTLNDPRIRLSISDHTLTIVESWARIKYLPKNEFVTLIGHDDIFDKGFLHAILDLISQHPDAALYQTGARLIDSNGRTIRSCRPIPAYETAAGYLCARFAFDRDIFGTGYVMRSADYDRLGGIPPFERLFFSDDALWLSIMLGSYKVCDPTEYCAVRIHPGSESASQPAAWRSILKGLKQFVAFLNSYAADDAEVRSIIDNSLPEFLLSYHRNAAIFALVESSQAKMRISPDVIAQIEASAAWCAPSTAGRLWLSPKTAFLRALNASPARILIPSLWSLYYQFKNNVRRAK
jgi:hypothetical protein